MNQLLESLQKWQGLAGSFVGAFIPIAVTLLIYIGQRKQAFRRVLVDTSILVAQAINDLHEAREELELFEGRVSAMIKAIDGAHGGYFIGHTNFPTFSLDYGNRFVDARTKSVYLTNKFLLCHTVIKHVNASLHDIQFEFRRAVSHDHERLLAANDLQMSPETQKNLLRVEVEGTLTAIQLTKQNIAFAIKALVSANTYLLLYVNRPNITRWRYEGILSQKLRKDDGTYTVESQLAQDILKVSEEIEKKYQTNLAGH